MPTKTGINIYINGIKHNSTPQADNQTAYNISDMVHPGEQFDIQVSNVFDDDTESELSTVQTFTLLEDTINLTTTVLWYRKVYTGQDDPASGTLKLQDFSVTGFKNGAFARRAINGNNAISFKPANASGNQGNLGITNTYPGITDGQVNMDFVIVTSAGAYSVREGANIVHTGSGVTENTEFTIRVNSGVVSAELNGTTIYTSPLTYNFPLAPIGILRLNTGVSGVLREVHFETMDNLVDNHLTGVEEYIYYDIGKTPAFTINDTALDSLYWPDIKLSANWPEIPTTKKYFVIYSTDHGTNETGGIAWAEFDEIAGNELDGFVLQGFIERGIMFQGDQIETPRLIRIPTSRSGINEELFLYAHAEASHPDVAVGTQQTILYTTTGGELHNAVWTPRGAVLGLVTGEDHTGYLRVWWDELREIYVGRHSYSTANNDKGKVSTSPDGINWTRTRIVDTTDWTNAPVNTIYDKMYTFPFTYNNVKYGFVCRKFIGDNFDSGISLTTLDEDNVPVEWVANILEFKIRGLEVYFKGNKAYFLIKEIQLSDFYIWEFDMNDLDLYL